MENDKKAWREALAPYTVKSNTIAVQQILVTFLLYALVWYFYGQVITSSLWLALPFSLLMAMFVLRFFVLMHDCGHGSLFTSPKVNKFVGYLLGVITGMPQYVWSKHHAYHHTTNGNWEKYKGPLSVISTEEYAKLSDRQKTFYRVFRHPLSFVTLGGFIYVLFNPRFNWIVGLIGLVGKIISTAFTVSLAEAYKVAKTCPSKKWKTPKEFRHMTYNNLLLLTLWYFMIQWLGALNFFTVYVLTLTLSGGLGILFFTVQHNFEHSYASDTERVNYFKAALAGTSYLKLPKLLNWFTADIAYHHIHHLSTAIPNYNLAACHKALESHFTDVKRISIKDIPHSVQFILWDRDKEVLVSVPN